jgi:hypothetical protein
LLAAIAVLPLYGQLTTGIVEGSLRDAQGHLLPDHVIAVSSAAGFHITLRSSAQGDFTAVLPYGQYSFAPADSPTTVIVAPLQTTHIDLIEHGPATQSVVQQPGLWRAQPRTTEYPYGFSLWSLLFALEPSSVTSPLDLTGLHDNRLATESQRGESIADTRYALQGMEATDSWQPGYTMILPNLTAFDEVVVRSTFSQPASTGAPTEVGLFLADAGSSWHAQLSSGNTGAALSSRNLPAGLSQPVFLRQSEYYKWLTRDGLEIGGPIAGRADVFASAWGQWASQTVPLAPVGNDQNSRLLFANIRGRVRLTDRDQLEALYVGSRIDLSNFGEPAAIEALAGNRMMPSFSLPGGTPGQGEIDYLDFVQAAWSHLSSKYGTLQIRYGYSNAHLDTKLNGQGPLLSQSTIELTTGRVTGAPPLGNFAIRTRHSVRAAWQRDPLATWIFRHRIALGADWNRALPRNRFTAPGDRNLITADRAAAFVIDFNTPADPAAAIAGAGAWVTDHISAGESLTVDFGIKAGFSRGAISGSSANLIAWNNLSASAGMEWRVPHTHGLALRGAYARLYTPLAGRYLDFGNPNSLSGTEYQWTDVNRNGLLDPGETGAAIMRFGGAYSSISPSLRQPYYDRFTVGAGIPLLQRITASLELFRFDLKDRIAATDPGIPAQAFSPVPIVDPGPDGITGTRDDRGLMVYSQNPATFGQDRYLLGNPTGLRFQNSGFTGEIHAQWHGLLSQISFTAEKSYGPTNPGNAPFQNDPEIVGSLYMEPNTAINAANRIYADRAYVGKISAAYRLPWAGIEVASFATYTDGLAFARLLLVNGLAQGPVLIDATVRGSPEGGNRSEHLLNWNLGLSRTFRLPLGSLTGSVQMMSLLNTAHKIQENDLTGPSFNLRLPTAIEEPRSVHFGFTYSF